MEFLILLGICVLVIGVVAWSGRRRGSDVDDHALARKANAEAEGLRSNPWSVGGGG
jgi:hypothetical protein